VRIVSAVIWRCPRCGRYEDGSRPCPNGDSKCPVAAQQLVNAALTACLQAMLRMIPDACAQHELEPLTDEEHDEAIALAATALYGEDRNKWPPAAKAAAEGEYD
jgi:hypothetical protein